LNSQPLSQRLKEDLSLISDIQVMLNIQTAKGAFKIGAYDSSDRYLRLFQTKNHNKIINDMRIIVPIIKLK
jgi:regulatory protein YycI of two-component signal transduction system YycFG